MEDGSQEGHIGRGPYRGYMLGYGLGIWGKNFPAVVGSPGWIAVGGIGGVGGCRIVG